MRYLIDSDWVIDLLADVPAAVQRVSQLSADGVAVSIITYMEAFQGVEQHPDPEDARAIFDAFFDSLTVLPLSYAIARRCARLRRQLKQRGRRVNSRALDLIIAATALEHDLILVTRNTADHNDIPGLTLYRT